MWLRGLFEVFSWLGFIVVARPRFQVGLLDFRAGLPSFRAGLRGLETGLRGLRAGLRNFLAISEGLGLKTRSPVTRISKTP